VKFSWSTGNSKRIERGDRVFLLRQVVEPRGIVASGIVTRSCYEEPHWENPRDTAIYIDVNWDAILDPEIEAPLARQRLRQGILRTVHWDVQMSGTSIHDGAAEQLERKWREHLLQL